MWELPNTAPDPRAEKLEDFRALLTSSYKKACDGKDINMVFHEHVSVIMRMVTPPITDYEPKPVDGTISRL